MAKLNTVLYSSRNSKGYRLGLSLVEGDYSIENNTSPISYEIRISTNSYTYDQYFTGYNWYINGQKIAEKLYADKNFKTSCMVYEPNYVVIASGTVNVAHNADGTLANVPVTAYFETSGTYAPGILSLSDTVTLNAIPRASSLTLPSGGFVFGTAADIGVVKGASTLYDRVRYSFVGSDNQTHSGYILGSASTAVLATSVSYTFAASLQNYVTASENVNVTITVETYKAASATSANLIGSNSYSAVITVPATTVPTTPSITASAVNTNSWISSKGYYVAGYTKVRLRGSASGAYGSTITRYVISNSVSAEVAGTALDYTATDPISQSGTKRFRVRAYDTRGRYSEVDVDVAFLAYNVPTFTMSVLRGTYSGGTWTADPTGPHIRVTYTALFTLTDNTANSSGVTIACTGQTSQTGKPVSGTVYFTGTSADSDYDITASVTDLVGNTGTNSTTMPSAAVILNINPTLNAIGIGRVASQSNRVESAINMYVEKKDSSSALVEAGNSTGGVSLRSVATGRGIYDVGHNHWMIYDDDNDVTHIPNYQVPGRIYYGRCTTAAATQAKTVTVDSTFALAEGVSVRVRFANAQNYAGAPTLNVNGTGAINVMQRGSTAAVQYVWAAGEVVDFLYDGTNWLMLDGEIATTTYYGVTKLNSAINSTSTTEAATPSAVKQAYDLANAAVPKAGSRVLVWSNTSGATSGSWSNFGNYSSYLFIGAVSNAGAYVAFECPAELFVNTSTAANGFKMQFADETSYASWYLYYSGTTGRFSRSAATSSTYGEMFYVFGIL